MAQVQHQAGGTSGSAEGITSDPTLSADKSRDSSAEPKSMLAKAMEMTADKLGRSKSTGSKAQLSQSQPTLPAQGPSRLLSLRHRGKGKEPSIGEGQSRERAGSQSQVLRLPRTTSAADPRKTRNKHSGREDDSPFITPQSPPLGPSRPNVETFRGSGSIRLGTQTLIQALQAIPWAEAQDEDDLGTHDNTPLDTSDDDEDDGRDGWLASSIHTIYRPVARLRRKAAKHSRDSSLPAVPDQEETPRTGEHPTSEEEPEDDFERTTPQTLAPATRLPSSPGESKAPMTRSAAGHRRVASRSDSMATVKVQQRGRLAEKLRDVFQLSGIQEVITEMPCWLLRSILLQGYMYLTDSYLCFFAHMPSREDQVLKSGSLSKKSQRTKRWIRHWFILKNDVLSYYQSPTDPYFPHGIVDLRYAITCEAVDEKDFRIRTNRKSIKLSADSGASRDEWVKAIRKVMFKAQTLGDSVKVAIPYSVIVEVERSSAMDFSGETIQVRVAENSSIDSYFFACFRDMPAALEQIRDAVRKYQHTPTNGATASVIDTTITKPPTSAQPLAARALSAPAAAATDQTPRSPSTFRLPNLLRPLHSSTSSRGRSPSNADRETLDEFTHVQKRTSSSFMAVTTSPTSSVFSEGNSRGQGEDLQVSISASTTGSNHTYPPSRSRSPSGSELTVSPTREAHTQTGSWNVGVPSWFKMPSMPSRRALSSAIIGLIPGTSHEGVSEVLSSNEGTEPQHRDSGDSANDFGYFSVLESPETITDKEATAKFRETFAFDDRETLLGVFPGYIYRLLPVYGRYYISSNYLCFKATGPLSMGTRMVLPIRDVLSTQKSRAFHFGHYGVVVIVRGHEELFFEFGDDERRTAMVTLVEKQMEELRGRDTQNGDQESSGLGRRDNIILEEPAPGLLLNSELDARGHEEGPSSLPAVMFDSTSSTLLTFKPKESLHFTFLTIGSRGDVQPYIALAKGLIKDGHRTRIATHGEFREWIESHGIEFGYVGGDPAELMRICVENGTFTVSFLKEGVTKFRGWIDDLLKTSWEACQGTDVLVESPSAMAGFHIAEALKIPYFRAFTMTWSRTRAYPHAFAVPDRRMGGNYNYMSYVLFDQVFWRGTAGQINRWRRNTLGLGSTSLDRMEPHKIPFLYNFSPVIVPPPLDWPEWIHVTGYWFLDDADVSSKKWTPPSDLLEFMEKARKLKKKLVYIGFGSIVVSDPKVMTRCVIDAIVRSGVYAILSKGWSDRLVKNVITPDIAEPEEPLPPQIYPVASIPHDWLFKRVDAACHHGGAGTTGASLRAGIPTIIKPFFGDQFFWADRVEALGIGSSVRKLTVENLTQALVAATSDQKQIDRAREVGEKIRAEDGVGTSIEALYRDLEYARSLIKRTAAQGDVQDDGFDDAEGATIREPTSSSSSPERSGTRSGASSETSNNGAVSDWSVISE